MGVASRHIVAMQGGHCKKRYPPTSETYLCKYAYLSDLLNRHYSYVANLI